MLNGKTLHLDLKPLTLMQSRFVDAWFKCDEDKKCVRDVMKWKKADRVANMLRSDRVQLEIAERRKTTHSMAMAMSKFNISKDKKMELLWEIAKAGAEQGYDKVGNRIMVNPASSVQAIRELNTMQGHVAPTQTELTVTHEVRSEREIKTHILELQQEVQSLLALDGEFEILETEGVGEGTPPVSDYDVGTLPPTPEKAT